MTNTYNIGDHIDMTQMGISVVIGVDNYTLFSFSMEVHSWVSYTLVTKLTNNRWWLVNLPSVGQHVFTISNLYYDSYPLIKHLSGLVTLNSQGNHDLSDNIGALATYRIDDNTLHSEEIFPRAKPLIFTGRRIIL